MTEKTFNYSKSYFGFQLGRVRICTVFSIIFSLLGFPLLVTAIILDEYSDPYAITGDISVPLLVLSVISIIGICVMSYFTPLLSLKHLYTKTNADNILSLPLTGNQRFTMDMLSSILPFAVPFLFSCGITAIITANFPNLFSEADSNIALYAFKGFLCLIMFSTLNIAVITTCGRITEAILYPIGLNGVLFGISALGSYISIYDCVGICDTFGEVFASPLVRIWPIGNGISMFQENSGNFYGYAIIMTAVFTVLAYLGYKKRRAENIGKTFVFKFSYPLASTIVALTFILFYVAAFDLVDYDEYYNSSEIWVTITVMCVILLILMLILEVINYKKINGILKFIVKYVITLGGGVAACVLLALTDGFGIAHYIPYVSLIETASIQANHNNRARGETSINNYMYVHTDEAIKLITDEHKLVIDKAIKFDEEYDNTTYETNNYFTNIYIYYTLKNGRKITREYHILDNVYESEGFWENMVATEDYRTAIINERIKKDRNLACEELDKIIRLTNTHSDKKYLEKHITHKVYEELITAIEADLKADINYGRHDDAPICDLDIGHSYEEARSILYLDYYYSNNEEDDFREVARVTLYENYENTLAVLKKYGTIPKKEQNLDDAVGDDEIFMLWRIKKPDTNQIMMNCYSDCGGSAVFITGEEFKELAAHHVMYNVPDESEYIYGITRGVWSFLSDENYSPYEFINALAEIGIQYDNRSTFESSYIYYFMDWNYYQFLNESVNGRCDEIFGSRTMFNYSRN